MEIQSEQFEQLIAEALRAGPGSPSWHQAVQILQDAGQAGDEYRLLCRTRKNLAGGRDYRAVSAGPGFTRKLMDNIEHGGPPWRLPTASIIAIAAAVLIMAIIGAGVWFAFVPARPSASVAQLADAYFITTLRSEDFRSGMPSGFEKIGSLPMAFENGARVDAQPKPDGRHLGGGVRITEPFPPRESFAIESALEVTDAKSDLITQIFVSDQPEFAADTGLTPHELACIIDQGKVRVVLPDGKTAGDTDLRVDSQSACSIRIRLNANSAIVEHNGKTIWSGRHHLDAERPRVVGIRYLRVGAKSGGVTVKSLKVMGP